MDLIRSAIDGQVFELEKMLGVKDFRVNECDASKMTALHYAAWYNKTEVVAALLENNADPNARDVNQSTPLHFAARYKQRSFQTATGEQVTSPSSAEVTKLLLQHGAKINASDECGDTPLSMAVIRNNVEAAKILLSSEEVNIQAADKRGWSPLHYAAKFERLSIGKMLLEQGANARALTEKKGTPLMIASAEGNLSFVELLLENCLNDEECQNIINDVTVDGESALDLAVENKRKKIVALLLDKGAKVMKTCRPTRMSPLHLSAMAGGPAIARQLLKKEESLAHWLNANNATPLHMAVQQGRVKTTKLLLEHGADLEKIDHDYLTPLLMAVVHGEERVVRVLLEQGANVTALTKEDQSVIHLAAKHNRLECLKILLEHIKEDESLLVRIISADDKLGNSPLHLAAEKGYLPIAQLLLEHNADIENINENEESPIHVASKLGRTRIVQELLKGEDKSIMNSTQENGDTPLHLAASNGHTKVVDVLLEAGAEVAIRNRQFWTPLACAASRGHDDIVRLLLAEEAELSPADRSKRTPLHLAAMNGHPLVITLLLEEGAPISSRDNDGNNPLDLAIKFNQQSAAMAIVMSEYWKEALRNRTRGTKKYAPYTTPLRKLMRRMPEVAEKVFDRCSAFPHGLDIKDPDLEIKMDFEFLDDTYTCAAWGDPNLMNIHTQGQIYDKDGKLNEHAKPYTDDSHIREANHPLQTLVNTKNGDLLHHPLVLGLVRHKWRLAEISYFSFLLFYTIFVALITWNMVAQKPPFYYNSTLLEQSRSNASMCEDVWDSVQESVLEEPHPTLFIASAVIQWILCGIGITTEMLQIYSTPARYLSNGTNLLDWFTYIAVLITLIPIHPCYISLDWQWQLGASAMFIAWMNLILFLRRLPGVGIYVVMVGVICTTFFKFFVFCFSLFVFAFGFTFYVLLRNQAAFQTPGYAFVKTGVMMIGEIEFEDLFHGEASDFETEMYYEGITYFIFITFLCVATIIIMNLLTGLAVGDVQEIQEHARVKKLAMQVELALDVEVSLTEELRKYFQCVVGHLRIRPNKMGKPFMRKIGHFLSGPLSSKSIAEALYTEAEEQAEEKAAMEEDEITAQGQHKVSGATQTEQHLIAQVEQSKEQLKSMEDKVDRLEAMIRKLLEHSEIEFEEETAADPSE